jgi:hypothetical protein
MSCLQPFACLSEECKEPPKLFSSEVDWISHMTKAHGGEWPREMYKPTQWFCDVDHPNTLYFPYDQELVQHLRDTHSGTFNETQIATVLSQNTLSTPRDRHVCPLCNCVPDRLSRLMAANVNSEVITPWVHKPIHELTPGASSGSSAIPGLKPRPVLPFPSWPLRTTRFAGEQAQDEDSASVKLHSGKSPSKNFGFSKELERHIASHLRSIAFISIRNLASEEDAMSNASGQGERSSRKSNLRTDDEASEPSLLVFDDIPPEDREDDIPPEDREDDIPPERSTEGVTLLRASLNRHYDVT